MKERELFAKETFINLYNLTEFERIEKEDELFLEAKKLGLEKEFKKSLRKYEKILNKKIKIDKKAQLPKSNYDLKNYNFGDYDIDKNGITDNSNCKISYIPVLPIERYINQDTKKEKVKIIFYKDDKWQELIIDKTQLTIATRLLLLADYGLDVTSENVKQHIKYFSEMININNLKIIDSVSHLGWNGEDFIPYYNAKTFDGVNEFKNIFNAISTKGDFNLWHREVLKLRENKIIKLLMAITFASPLLEHLNVAPFIANLWSSLSGNGKTLTCMVAMSSWGNPATGALTLSSNNTHNYYMKYASFMRNITCFFDELQIIKGSKELNMNNLIMDLANGTEKGRLDKNSEAKSVYTWFGNFIFTNNDKLVKENSGEQIHNRVIDIEIDELIIKNGSYIANIIKNNYGFAGKIFIDYIKELGWENIQGTYNNFINQILEKTPATTKKASLFAVILTADRLANECIFHDEPLLIDDVLEYIEDKDEIKTSVLAKDYIISVISTNQNKFGENVYGEFWGRSTPTYENNEQMQKYFIDKQVLIRELAKGGFDFNTVKKEWSKSGFLEKNSQNKFIHQTKVNNVKGNYIVLLLN